MPTPYLHIIDTPQLEAPSMLVGFSGWMDGGEVSTGTIEIFTEKLDALPLAALSPEAFYLYNFPGTMDIASLFRPHVILKDGLIHHYEEPSNLFFYDKPHNLIMLLGKAPNFNWQTYSEHVFALVDRFGVRNIYFIGSVAGLVPHSREPRITASFSSAELRQQMAEFCFTPVNYNGPAGIVNHLMRMAHRQHINMVSLVAEIPAYLQGRNPKSIEAIVRRLARLVNVELDLSDLHALSVQLEEKLDKVIEERPELAQHIQTLEEKYDQNLFDTEMGDLKRWLLEQGIRLD